MTTTAITPISHTELNDATSYLFAEEEDICYKVGGTYCVCSTENGCNNIGVETPTPNVATTRNMLKFLKVLYEEYGIDYISIREHRRWRMLDRVRHFTNEKGVHFIKISDNLNIFDREIK